MGEEMRAEMVAELERIKEDLQRRIPGLEDEAVLALYLQALDQVEAALQEYWTHVTAEQNADNQQAAADETPTSFRIPERGEEEGERQQKDSELAQYAPSHPADAVVYEHVESRNAEIADLLGLSSP